MDGRDSPHLFALVNVDEELSFAGEPFSHDRNNIFRLLLGFR